ncbi:Potassium voltage-gated channel sub H member 2 [Datura stramonium]|uniref:Potassium voltage-gated channel sub H member 2 n=1 Tax=Datura stramonium TaxID=4076 RepID=A0ABS8RRL9_DATST|nr:Potassium voltage-gated channel sub H member 2 [Datura stramonium]
MGAVLSFQLSYSQKVFLLVSCRLEDANSDLSFKSDMAGRTKYGFNIEGMNTGGRPNNPSKSIKLGVKRGSEGLVTFGRTLKSGVTRAVFPEDLRVSNKKIFDPQDKSLLFWNRLLVISCILAVSIDPLFLYLPVFKDEGMCLHIDESLANIVNYMRTAIDFFYLIRMVLQFRTAYIAPSSRVFGRGELVIDPAQIATRYVQRYFIVDLLSILPLPQIFGAFWYLLSVERKDTCWNEACTENDQCKEQLSYLYCSREGNFNLTEWQHIGKKVLDEKCAEEENFQYGIYARAVTSGVLDTEDFVVKYCFCLWWGLQNLSTLGQGLETSTYTLENVFSIILAISGLLLFALLIGNMQTYLQSLTVRLEEMRVKRRDSEQWMHHRVLPPELRERVRRYDQYKWLETRGVDEENLVQNLPKDLRRDIKRHLCLNLVRRVPLFENMDERMLDAICERLKPSLCTESTYIVREGDPVGEMMFIIRGRLESVTTDGGRSGFFNRGILKENDFCGEELLTWALDPKSGSSLPPSTRTVKALTEVEAFALEAEEVKYITSQFRMLQSRQVQHTFRFYSQQWRTWAASFIQAAWRRHMRRKIAELRYNEEMEEDGFNENNDEETELTPMLHKMPERPH